MPSKTKMKSAAIAALAGLAAAALLPTLSGCASDIETEARAPRPVPTAGDSAQARLLLVETRRLARAFTPEGLKPSVQSFDVAYVLAHADGRQTPLPFLAAKDAGRLDVLVRADELPGQATWVGIAVAPTTHMEHLKGMQWRDVDDDFVPLRITSFTPDRLLHRRELRVCNPARVTNPAIRFSAASHTLRLCTPGGLGTYDPLSDTLRVTDPAACCPPAAQAPDDSRHRDAQDLVVDLAP